MATAVKRRKYSKYDTIPFPAYDGSAARQLEQEEVLRPRPLVRPRERAVVRPKVRVREAGIVSPFAVVGFLAVLVFAVLLLFSYVQLAVISDQVVSLRSDLTGLKTEEAKLRAQYELAYDLSAIEETVTSNGSMVKPQAGQIYSLDLSEEDSVVHYDQESAAEAAGGLLDAIGEFVDGVLSYFR